ncbi:FAD/NAD(P)-binding domain-containing protein [Phialemonium atrogriseum]|uniref:FAD/NAD(P)-binding domain-containing protein n=1 Tax=Phialemonium atrogriseum TaxID=1093897 RepID=A0AAJ0BQD8_9PEZI|nr:FAD/NAD(P)-binding domain-containing protein [Phialemonium atrogriseum]KAK1762549.1 FAD/NAD(P)-binding domain-containing protein [Phialemonium atrogriseum]
MALNIAIVGGGIAGLSAGVSLRRAGHTVTIYERSALNNEVGAAINVPPNASRPLLGWGLDPVAAQFVPVTAVALHEPFGLKELQLVPMGDWVAHKYRAPFYFAHRVDLHQALKTLATTEEGDAPGTPVVIHLKSEVVGYDPETPSITLASGEVITPDVVIAADGVNSIAVEAVLGKPNPAQPQEFYNCCYRFLIPASALESDPDTAFFSEDRHGKMRIFVDTANWRRLVCYPCRNNEILNFVAMFHNADMGASEKEDWHASANKSKMLEVFKAFHPGLLKVINKATDVKYWPLLFRAPIPTWTKGKMVLAGDAAHPMLPHQGQGGAQGLEDGIALGIAMCGATRETVAARLAAYERIRINRASAIQTLSNAGQDQVQLIHKEAAKYMGSEEAVPKTPHEFLEYNFGHDVVDEARRALEGLDSKFSFPANFFQKSGPFLP